MRMCHQPPADFDRQGLAILEANHQKQPEARKLITDSYEGFHQLGNTLVTGQATNEYCDRRLWRNSQPRSQLGSSRDCVYRGREPRKINTVATARCEKHSSLRTC